MNRVTELEIIAATREEPSRALLRAAIVAQRQGKIDAAARIAVEHAAKRSLRWWALLLALDATELRMGGAVKLTTPDMRWLGPELGERWGHFDIVVYPDNDHLVLCVEQRPDDVLVLRVSPPTDRAWTRDVKEAIQELAVQVHAHLGCTVSLEVDR